MRRIFIAIKLLFCLSLLTAPAPGVAQEQISLKIATANKKGVYYPVGLALANIAAKEGMDLTVLPSNGSHENLIWISRGVTDLALAQSDTVFNAYNGSGFFEEKLTNFKVIASLYSEVVYILVRTPLHITGLQDLRGKRISIGPVGSGTELTSRAILEAAGIGMEEIKEVHMSLTRAERALSNNLVDVVFQTSGIPSTFVKGITDRNEAVILRIDPEIVQRLLRKYEYFVASDIPASTYDNHDKQISTLGVRALLVGRGDLEDETAYRIARAIYKNRRLLTHQHEALWDLHVDSALEGVATPVFDGTKKYLKESGYYQREVLLKIAFFILSVGFIAFAVYLLIQAMETRNIVKIIYFFTTRNIARVLIALLVIWLAGSLALHIVEHKGNTNYTTLHASLWSGLINMVSFGQNEPSSLYGRIVATVMMLFGLAGVAWFTGMIVSVFVQKRLPGVIMMDRMAEHYVIINWNQKGHGIIKQLHSNVLSRKRPIIIINEKEIQIQEGYSYKDLYFVTGNPENLEILRKASVQSAHSVIILSPPPDEVSKTNIPLNLSKQLSDSKVIMSILAINGMLRKEIRNKRLTIIVEILDPQRVELAMNTGNKIRINVKVVSSAMLAQDLMAQAAVVPELTEIYDELLSYDDNRCAIYKKLVPDSFVGKSRNELFIWLLGLRDKGVHITPIGLIRNQSIYLNSKADEIEKLMRNDYFIGICYSEDELDEIDKYAKEERPSLPR